MRHQSGAFLRCRLVGLSQIGALTCCHHLRHRSIPTAVARLTTRCSRWRSRPASATAQCVHSDAKAPNRPEQRALTLTAIRPFDVAAWVKELDEHSAPSVKQQLAAVRMLFDWLVIGQVVPMNPAAAVRGRKHVVKTGKTPVLDAGEWRKLIDSIPTETVRDLRDRALIATLSYSFARITAALKMKVEDLRPQGAGWRVRLHEKGGKEHEMPCHHALAEALHAYIAAACIAEDRKGWLFRTSPRHNAVLTEQPMNQADAWRMIRRRAVAAGIMAPIGNHTFRATGITTYLGNGGTLEHAQSMAAHESPRTTKLYDRTQDRLTQDEVERIRL